MSRNATVTNRLERGSVLPGNAITRDDIVIVILIVSVFVIVSVLTPLELAQYDLSAKSNPAKLKALTSVAVERLNARKAQRNQQTVQSAPLTATFNNVALVLLYQLSSRLFLVRK
jgi:hypothetical protein